MFAILSSLAVAHWILNLSVPKCFSSQPMSSGVEWQCSRWLGGRFGLGEWASSLHVPAGPGGNWELHLCQSIMACPSHTWFFNHATNVLLRNYSFGKSVRTSTLCMTQVIFPKIVYIQINSLIIHCVTIPVGQKLTYTKLTCAIKQLGKFQKIMSWL